MCTSFIWRKDEKLIGMNFDNNGMKYSVNKTEDWFVVYVDGGRGKYPSFGVSKNGKFFNNLLVDSNGKGNYRRPSNKVTHTTKLVTDILSGVISLDDFNEYLSKTEVVNTPDHSCHNMIIDDKDNVWIIEPGRGCIYSPAEESKYYVMSNESIIDMRNRNVESGCTRYGAIKHSLEAYEHLNVEKAFDVLAKAFQKEGEWVTELSFVYSKEENKVYYCFNGNIENIELYEY